MFNAVYYLCFGINSVDINKDDQWSSCCPIIKSESCLQRFVTGGQEFRVCFGHHAAIFDWRNYPVEVSCCTTYLSLMLIKCPIQDNFLHYWVQSTRNEIDHEMLLRWHPVVSPATLVALPPYFFMWVRRAFPLSALEFACWMSWQVHSFYQYLNVYSIYDIEKIHRVYISHEK